MVTAKPAHTLLPWLFLFTLLVPFHASTATLTGKVVKVADGDTITILVGTERHRIQYRYYAKEQTPEQRGQYEFAEFEAKAKRVGLWQEPNAVWCSRFEDGEAHVTREGDVVCGKGQCAKTFGGDLFCSSVDGGAALKDSDGRVRCEGQCERAVTEMCEQTLADSVK